MLRARVGGLTFEGSPKSRKEAFMIAPDGWSGWDEGVDVRRDETSRPVAHGSFDARGYLSARVITISGTILADTPAALAVMRQRLTGLLADGQSGRLVVDQPDDTSTWADVRLASRTAVTVRGGAETDASFQVTLWAANMRKFGELRSFVGPAAQVFHRGNFPALPSIEITGTLPSGYRVASQGRIFNVGQALTAGQTHRIDMASGWLYRNGVLQSSAVVAAETFTIPAGAVAPVTFTPDAGSGVMTVKVHDTFV